MIFPGKTAVYVSYPYSKEHSCKKSEKSLEQLSRKSGYQLTNRQTDQLTLPSLTSTNVENCNGDPVTLLNVRTWDLLKPLNLFNLSQQYTVMLS